MRKLLIALAVVVAAGALYYVVAAPRIALAAIERAARADDVVALAYHLDVASIRAGLRADFEPDAPTAAPSDDPLERLGAAFGTAVESVVGIRNTVDETFARATTRYEAVDAFVLRVPSGSGDAATEFVLRPRGFVWQITEVRLPAAR